MHAGNVLALEPPTDETLMLAYGRGDARAFETLYLRHKGATWRYFLRHAGGDVHVAQELHQDLWLRVVGARERYAAQAKFATWLYTLARHRMVDHWRARRSETTLAWADDETVTDEFDESTSIPTFDDTPHAADDPLRATLDAETRTRLVAALVELPVLQRDAFLLHVECGLALEEIARLTDAPAETVKSRLRYAYRRLRARLEETS